MAVLTDMSGDPIERLKRGILMSCTPGFEDAHPEIVEAWLAFRVKNPIEPEPYQAQMAIGLGLMEEGFEGKLNVIEAPTLILFGADDKVVPPGNADLLAGEIPNHTIKILPTAGHFYPLDATETAVAAIQEFLNT
jgi:pimeloyl-ACP methyl ester carboxylesterase